MPLYNSNNLILYKRLNCARAKQPSIDHCIFDNLSATCGSYLQYTRKTNIHPSSDKDDVTTFVQQNKTIPFQLNNSTGGVIEIESQCHCSLCLFDPSWFGCHCSKCLPSHAFTNTPDPKHCPYLNIKPTFRVYRASNSSLIEKGWAHQLEKKDVKCCCIFHKCSINQEPCLCKMCVLDFNCDCTVCGGKCIECGDICNVEEVRNTLECKHTKCDPLILEWRNEIESNSKDEINSTATHM